MYFRDNIIIGLTIDLFLSLFPVICIIYTYQVSTKYNDAICLISLYSMVFGLITSLNIETIVSIGYSCYLFHYNEYLISNMVSIGFALFKDTYMDTYDITIPNWIKSNVQQISKRYLIILAIVMFVFIVIALILRLRQQGEQLSIGFNAKHDICYSICHDINSNGYCLPPLTPIQAANCYNSDCFIAPIGFKITIAVASAKMNRLCKFHDTIVSQISEEIRNNNYPFEWIIISLFNVLRMICNKMYIIYDILLLNWCQKLLFNGILILIVISCSLV